MPSIFDAYDYVGYIVPGAILMFGVAYLFPWITEQFGSKSVTTLKFKIGGIGSFVIVAFVAGQLLHQLGHLIRDDLRIRSTNAVACGNQDILSTSERNQLLAAIKNEFAEFEWKNDTCNSSAWRDVVRRIDVKLRAMKMTERIDILFRSIDLNMALTIAFAVLIAIIVLFLILPKRADVPGLRFALSW
jgi:hypothetical protein